MIWLLRRVLAIWLIFAVMFAAVVVIVRLDQKPHPMRVFGFDDCEGEACFRGIKFGTDWTKVARLDSIVVLDSYRDLKGIVRQQSYLRIDNLGSTTVPIYGADRSVVSIYITPPHEPAPSFKPLPGFTTGDVIAEYGLPCRVLAIRDPINTRETSVPWLIYLLYPKFQVLAELDYVATNLRLPMSLPFRSLEITRRDFPDGTGNYISGACDTLSEFAGPWRGFASVEVYHARNRRDADVSRAGR
jgi:hypothetical protein